MDKSPHLFTPKNDTYEERIKAFKTVLTAQRNIERSALLVNDPDWANRVGSMEEIESAQEVISMSFDLATKHITKDEIHQAHKENLLSTNELKEYKIINAKNALIMHRSTSPYVNTLKYSK